MSVHFVGGFQPWTILVAENIILSKECANLLLVAAVLASSLSQVWCATLVCQVW